HNSDGGYSGSYSLEGALTNSVNVVTANLIFRMGPPAVRQLAKEMGVTTEMQNDLSISLGSADIALLDMIKVYGTFAARGRRPEPIIVSKVTTRDGNLIADFGQNQGVAKWQQVLATEHADMMTKMMRSVVEEGTAGRIRYNHNINSDIAAKTGTTQSHADGWFMCYTPNLVLGAWVGGITPAVRFRDMNYGQGAYTALPVCGIFLEKLFKTPQYAALKKEKFPEVPQWVLDSMACTHKKYTSEELASFEARRVQDSIDSSIFTGETVFPQDRPQDQNNQDLRENDPKNPKNTEGGKNNTSAQNLPTTKPEIKLQPTSSGVPIKSQPPPPSKMGKPGGQ
ncbi:MAG: hypothetical protein HC817_13560, partial [Saprospiraceae bacterium]|nr:hypothetical protein [Saprospiraceae bacterium]